MMYSQKGITGFILVLALLLFPATTFALGLSVTPTRMSVQSVVGKPVHEKVQVTNTSGDVALFDVYSDEMNDMLHFTPSSFTLEAGEMRSIDITIQPSKSGIYTTTISIVARTLSNTPVVTGGGVKVPLVLTVEPDGAYKQQSGNVSSFEVIAIWSIIVLIAMNILLMLYAQVRKLLR